MANEHLNERQQEMKQALHYEGELKITDLSSRFSVTEMTIRRDLEKLEKSGYAHRTFGGAIPANRDLAFQERATVYLEEKRKIGRIAAELIRDGNAVFIDGGTTTMEVARALKEGREITVVTNAVNIASELAGKRISTIMIGGSLQEETLSVVGPIAEKNLADMAFDQIFLGATGMTVDHGFSNSNVFEADIKRLSIERADEVNIVLDHSKFGKKVLSSFASLDHVHRVITNQLPDESYQRAANEHNLEFRTK